MGLLQFHHQRTNTYGAGFVHSIGCTARHSLSSRCLTKLGTHLRKSDMHVPRPRCRLRLATYRCFENGLISSRMMSGVAISIRAHAPIGPCAKFQRAHTSTPCPPHLSSVIFAVAQRTHRSHLAALPEIEKSLSPSRSGDLPSSWQK